MVELQADSQHPQPLAECRIVGNVSHTVALGHERGEMFCRFPLVVNESEYTILIRGSVCHEAIGLRPGDLVEIEGSLAAAEWKIANGQKRAQPLVHAHKLTILCTIRHQKI